MDYEEKRKRQTIRVIIAEVGMVISVVVLVVVTTLAAMGFFISADGQIEQSGLMRLHSLPTGSTVTLDGATLFARTNLSRMLAAGEHTLSLSRDGYDEWHKTIVMSPGALMPLYYPRLFLQERDVEAVLDLQEVTKATSPVELEFYSVSDGRNYALYALKDELKWQLLDFRNDDLRTTTLDLTKILPAIATTTSKTTTKTAEAATQKFNGEILRLTWSADEGQVLVKLKNLATGQVEWWLINLKEVARSQNLTEIFGTSFDEVKVIDDSANQLYVLEHNQLRRVNAASGTMSRVLVNNVASFANWGGDVAFVTLATTQTDGSTERTVGVLRSDDESATVVTTVTDDEAVRVALSHYFGEDYLCYVIGQRVTVLSGELPEYRKEESGTLESLEPLVEDEPLTAVPELFMVSPNGEYLVARTGQNFAVIDLYIGQLYEYEAPRASLNWFDASLMYAVTDGQIVVWDFDGTNWRNLAESRAEGVEWATLEQYPILVTANNRWLYYWSQDADDGLVLVRERILN